MLANCFGQKLGKILFVFLGVKVSIYFKEATQKGTLYMFWRTGKKIKIIVNPSQFWMFLACFL